MRHSVYIQQEPFCLRRAILNQGLVVIPPSLRNEVLRNLHSAHQEVYSMESRSCSIVFWPGISTVIQETRDRYRSCNKTAPSQAATPPAALDTPSTPFESVLWTSAITAYAITSSLVTVCRVGLTSTRRPRVHHTPELLTSLLVFARCSPLSASLKSCQGMGAMNAQLPKPPTFNCDGRSAIAYHRSHFRGLTAGLK